MDDATVLREALLWAAGNEASRFELSSGHYADFLEAVRLHRLSGRLVRRLRSDPPAVSRQFVDDAVHLHDLATTDIVRKIELADRLGKAMREQSPDDCLVLIKGFTLYALTGDPLTLRWSGDLDVIVAEPDRFVDLAMRHGFALVHPLDHLAEYAVLHSAEDGWLELHSRFDVTSIPAEVTRAEVDPVLHPGAWEQQPHFRVRYLRHRHFTSSLAGSSAVPETIRPLRAEMAALVSASHMFKNFLRCPYPLPVATIPLDEIATFADLCGHPSFDSRRFADLVDEFDGQTAASFSRVLAEELLGHDPLAGPRPDRFFPVNLWWDGLDGGGFPVDVPWDAGQLVYRDRSMRDLVDALGATDVCGAEGGPASGFTLLDGGRDARAARYIFRRDRENDLTVRCTVSVGSDGLLLSIDMPRVRDDRMIAIAAFFQDYRFEIFVNCRARDPFTDYSVNRDAEPRVEVFENAVAGTHTIALRLSPHVAERCRVDGAVHGVLVVREQEREWSRITAGAAVPLRIAVPQAARCTDSCEMSNRHGAESTVALR